MSEGRADFSTGSIYFIFFNVSTECHIAALFSSTLLISAQFIHLSFLLYICYLGPAVSRAMVITPLIQDLTDSLTVSNEQTRTNMSQPF